MCEHLETFLARAEERSGRPLPGFVVATIRKYVDCGIPGRGFARVWCEGCGHDKVVAFS